MAIKINGGPPNIPEFASISRVKEVSKAVPSEPTVDTMPADRLNEIARNLASGQISRKEALDLLVAETMNTKMVQDAPKKLREELAEVLTSLLETDPYLVSLARNLPSTE